MHRQKNQHRKVQHQKALHQKRQSTRPSCRNTSSAAAKSRYVLFHKPYGVLSQFTQDHPGQRTLAEFDLPSGVYPVGRLDQDSEGLLLLSNDGDLIHHLLDPKFGHERTYAVQVEGVPTEESLQRLRHGVTLGKGTVQEYHTRPAKIRILQENEWVAFGERIPSIRERKSIPTTWLAITLTEGKNRQVRKMTASVGHPTLRLIRTAIGILELRGLAQGNWVELLDIPL